MATRYAGSRHFLLFSRTSLLGPIAPGFPQAEREEPRRDAEPRLLRGFGEGRFLFVGHANVDDRLFP